MGLLFTVAPSCRCNRRSTMRGAKRRDLIRAEQGRHDRASDCCEGGGVEVHFYREFVFGGAW